MGNFNRLHFSDLHFSAGGTFDTGMARDALIICLEAAKFKCDYIFITGDIADKRGYSTAKPFVERIKNATGVPPEQIYWAVGNHDIKRGAIIRGD